MTTFDWSANGDWESSERVTSRLQITRERVVGFAFCERHKTCCWDRVARRPKAFCGRVLRFMSFTYRQSQRISSLFWILSTFGKGAKGRASEPNTVGSPAVYHNCGCPSSPLPPHPFRLTRINSLSEYFKAALQPIFEKVNSFMKNTKIKLFLSDTEQFFYRFYHSYSRQSEVTVKYYTLL